MSLLELVLIGSFTVTSYRSVPQQTDHSPFVTATGERVKKGGIAASRDLMCPASFFKASVMRLHKRKNCILKHRLHYGDKVYVEKYGWFRINDCMNKRHKKRFDIWVKTYNEEKVLGTRKLKIYMTKNTLSAINAGEGKRAAERGFWKGRRFAMT